MESVQDRLGKLREERIAREKARIEKLRELNLKKYNKTELQSNTSKKNNVQVNGIIKRSVSAPIKKDDVAENKINLKLNSKPLNANGGAKSVKDIKKTNANNKPNGIPKLSKAADINRRPNVTKPPKEANNTNGIKNNIKPNISEIKSNHLKKQESFSQVTMKGQASCRSIAVLSKTSNDSRKNIQPKQQNETKSRESVFDRLYKPKVVPKVNVDTDAMKLKTDPSYLKQVIRNSNLIINKRHTVFETKEKTMPVRRSISAVHFKRISKCELSNCIHKWASIGEKINKVHLNEVNEDESVKEEKFVSAVKSERKRVKFQTPISSNFNTPKPAELQERLQKWLQKRGKSLDSYHHLQCFGLHHLPQDLGTLPNKLVLCDDENKENIALEHDSDNESFTENMSNKNEQLLIDPKSNFALDKWRRASYVSDSVGYNDSCESTMTSTELHQVDELLLGALNDLTELLREGFDWEQCARWLRAIRERFPEAPEGAAYWECRAALEERRGDLPASVQCWERAIANGTEQSVVEANLDQLLDKFMQLKISPSSGRKRPVDPKLLDVKNVFKSTIIRFAVQQAKLRQSNGTPKYTVTPVRRSSRLSCIPRATPLARTTPTPVGTPCAAKDTPRLTRATPLSLCTSFHQAAELFPVEFKPNKALIKTP